MKLGTAVPNFTADTTEGTIQFYEWQGNSWCLLFSHPKDFTPVCTTEMRKFHEKSEEFEKRNVKLLGLSCDSVDSHMNWVEDIKALLDSECAGLSFPIIADENRSIAVQLEMLDANDNITPVRALYIIDPEHHLRLSMVYPITTGRNVVEILRVIDALQLTDRLQVAATPADWKPGEKVMILPNATEDQVSKSFPNGIDVTSVPSGLQYLRTATDY